MSTTNILDLNNRVDELAESYPADKVMLSDGVTSVEDALDGLATTAVQYLGTESWSGTMSNGFVSIDITSKVLEYVDALSKAIIVPYCLNANPRSVLLKYDSTNMYLYVSGSGNLAVAGGYHILKKP